MIAPKRIFLGHASEDKPRVRELYHQLKAKGLSPWLDAVDLMPGQNWREEIPKVIKSAGVFLACLSKRSVAKQSYVQREFRYALSAYAERQPGSIFLIPVRLDDCEVPDLRLPELELHLRDLHWVDLFEPDGFERLVQSIEHTLGAEAKAQSEKAPSSQPSTESLPVTTTRPPKTPDIDTKANKSNPTIRAAWIGAITVILAGILTLPWLANLFTPSNPSPIERKKHVNEQDELPEPVPQHELSESFKDCIDCPEMVVIPAGSFTMGSPPSEEGRNDNEGPQRQVSVASFALGKYEVTFDEWDACVSGDGCDRRPDDEGWGRGDHPVINISWEDAQQYVGWLSKKTGHAYRLPSEAEWEYAARAFPMSEGPNPPVYAFGDKITEEQANFGNNIGRTTKVGNYPANDWGLYDMHGNVWESVEDRWHASYEGAPSEGSPWYERGEPARVHRGGSWSSNPRHLRSASRLRYRAVDRSDYYGFRVARTLTP